MDDSLDLIVPPELEAGVNAEWLNAWFSPHQLTLDFATPLREAGLTLTARVRVPATAALEIAASVQQGIREYELQYGEIRSPRPRGEE